LLTGEVSLVKGELLLKKDDHNSAQAQSCFERAIEIARKQNAKFRELGATTSLLGCSTGWVNGRKRA
jgi:hypothetical protein